MAEKHFISVTNSVHDDDVLATNYLNGLNGKRTARHASEQGYNSPLEEEVAEATRKIRNDIKGVFYSPDGDEATDDQPLSELKSHYWDRASKVGVEYGTRPGFDLDDYFKVSPDRSYQDIKLGIERDFAPNSIPRSVLDAIDAYSHILNINPAHATTITTEIISRGLPQIQAISENIAVSMGITTLEANKVAFAQFIDEEVPYHINTIMDKYGTGDKAVKPYFNKSDFYPPAEAHKEDIAITMSVDDVKGLIRVYDIQSRPYNKESLNGASELALNPALQSAML
ncbi:MAG: hypothetical protein WAW80_01975 [Candidatus Saccharimonadales bacterium]